MAIWEHIQAHKKLLFIPPVLIGLGLVGLALATKQPTRTEEVPEQARTLRVVRVERREVTPLVIGYGTATPARTWRAVSEVAGRVTDTHPELDPGTLVEAGASLVQIDPTDYELTIDRLKAEARSLQAQIQQTEVSIENDRATLAIEDESVELALGEYRRLEKLARRDAASRSEADRQKRTYLTQQRQARELRNSLNLAPAQLERYRAELAATQARIRVAQRDLERTHITAPFPARLAQVAIEPGQYVAKGQELFEIHGTDAIEVEARIPLDDLARLIPDRPPTSDMMPTLESRLRGLEATVRVRSGTLVRRWPAKLVRLRERVEPRSRTLGVVVRVTDLTGASDQQASPLLEGTFCEVEFSGHSRPDQLIIPRAAVRNGQVFVVNAESRLERREVIIRFAQEDRVAVTGHLLENEWIVVSDPTPAVIGMLVDPVPPANQGGQP